MTRKARGKWSWRISTAAIMAMMATSGAGPAAAQAARDFNPPQSSLLLSRTFVRALPDGKTITTQRNYEVRITRSGAGFQVDGRLVEVKVDAPPSLQGLAELERRRPDIRLFPFALDPDGMIVGNMDLVSSPSVDTAVTQVSERIGGTGLAALDMLQAQAFVARIREGGARSAWPKDVFHPAPGMRSEARSLSLPGGGEGQVLIELVGQGAGPGGQVAVLSRVVTTNLGGDKRTTQERWQISRYAANSDR